uniref:Uncharacterized protein n=1 Tax=Globisporangium ultimum (strain ATCC 200006 / CBS 805.95 / DAOM BR144) TaxID=431595 RepID=K3WZ01_GLOUD
MEAVAASPSRALLSFYSVDAFAEYSSLAVSRAPSTSALGVSDTACERTTQEQDEELFRDLFAAENDDEDEESAAIAARRGASAKKPRMPPRTNQKAPIWRTDATLSTPCAPNKHASPAAHEPTLSASVPRLNLAELMTARPGGGDLARNVWGGGLEQLVESNEEDKVDDNDGERPESSDRRAPKRRTNAKPPSVFPSNGTSSSSSSNNAALHQETLRFLEKLDLKALLHTPRPDVLDFYPTTAASSAVSGSAVIPPSAHVPRDEELEREAYASVAHGSLHKPSKHQQGRKDSDDMASLSRLSHMELTYGTTTSAPRKTRKETLERLANPILGFTSTLQALSPDSRRKREVAIDDAAWDNCVSPQGSAFQQKRKPQKHKTYLEQVALASGIYEAAASFSKKGPRKRSSEPGYVPKQSNNQRDDERENATKLTKERQRSVHLMEARKAALKKKIEAKQSERVTSNQSSELNWKETERDTWVTAVGSTFLTQHEGEEVKLESRVKREQFTRHPSFPPQLVIPASKQPRRPVSVRPAAKPTTSRAPNTTRIDHAAKQSSLKTQRSSRRLESTTTAHKSSNAAGETPVREQHQKPVRPPGKCRGMVDPVRRSSNQDGVSSGRRPFTKAANGPTSAKKPIQATVPLAPKRKLSPSRKLSNSAMLLMGTTTAATPVKSSGNASSRHDIRATTSVPPKGSTRGARSSRQPEHEASHVKALEPKQRGPKDAATPVKASVVLPAIRRPPAEKATSARWNFASRRTKANA